MLDCGFAGGPGCEDRAVCATVVHLHADSTILRGRMELLQVLCFTFVLQCLQKGRLLFGDPLCRYQHEAR